MSGYTVGAPLLGSDSGYTPGPPAPAPPSAGIGAPSSSTDNAIVTFNGTSGELVQSSLGTISPTGTLSVPSVATTALTIPTDASAGYVLTSDVDGNATWQAPGSGAMLADGELLIGRTGLAPVAAPLTGTTNRVTVTNGSGSITLGGPQDIAPTSTPIFSKLKLSSTSTQLLTSWGTAFPTTISVPTMSQTTTVTLGDPLNTTASFLLDKTYPGLMALPGWTSARVVLNAPGLGNNDLYIVPSGKRAMILSMSVLGTNVSTTAYPTVGISGSYYKLAASTTLANNNMRYTLGNPQFIYEFGDTVAVNISGTNQDVIVSLIIFPDTIPLRTYRVNPNTSPQGLLFGGSATSYGFSSISPMTTGPVTIYYSNTTGAPTTSLIGLSGISDTATVDIQSVADGGVISVNTSLLLQFGDEVDAISNSNTAGQLTWANLWEPSGFPEGKGERKAPIASIASRTPITSSTPTIPKKTFQDKMRELLSSKLSLETGSTLVGKSSASRETGLAAPAKKGI